MPNQPPVWGPHHQQGLPGGIRIGKDGGYWWGITTGTWLAFFAALGSHGSASTAVVAVVMIGAAAAVGWGEAGHGKPFASGRWVLFGSATLASAGLLFLPALAYVAGFYGHRHVRQNHGRGHAQPGTPPAAPHTHNRSAPTGSAAAALVAARQMPCAAAPAAVSVPVVSGGYFGVDARGQVMAASARGAALVIGPPGSGKTQSVIMPSVAYASGAVVSTSMKAEVLAATATARSLRGKCWLFDPGGPLCRRG